MRAIDCEAVRDALPDTLHGRAAPLARRAIELHIAECEACAEERRVLTLVRRHGVEPDERLLEQVLRARTAPRSWRFAPGLAAAAGVALALMGGSQLLRPPQRAETPAPLATVRLVEEAVGQGALTWLASDPLLRGMVGLDDLSLEELEQLLMELES